MSELHTDDLQLLLEGIQRLYTDLALHPEKDFGWGKGKESARQLGYDGRWLDNFPDSVWQSAAPVGNPFDLGPIMPGETVVDLGCGAGIDLCIARGERVKMREARCLPFVGPAFWPKAFSGRRRPHRRCMAAPDRGGPAAGTASSR